VDSQEEIDIDMEF
jgi:hypothetical protein